ncbi:MAG: LysR family transcriptional regulator [Proteobacteria bacterium]|nr:LysR family transcriptional regulator [Pseudomonadota bacterium]
MLSLRQIRYFLAVAETGNLSQAAAGLFVAQPALSRQIALMEEELGFPLFVREARGVSLTPAGALFRERIGAVSQAIDEAAEDARCLARGESGVLRLLHSSSIPIGGPLLDSLQAFAEVAPAARVDLDRVSSEVQVAEIAAGRADLGVARMPVLRRDPAVQFIPLARERLVVAIPAAHPLADRQSLRLADLAEVPFVSAVHRERGGLARRMTDLCLQRGFVPRMGNVISRKTSMLSLVAAGFGIAVIPECMAVLVPAGARVRPLDDSEATADAAILLPQAPSPLARRFAALCEERWRQALAAPG